MEYYYRLLEQITTGSDSSLLLFFVIVAGLVLPLYWLILKDRKYTREHENKKHDKYIEREREIINVMRDISAIIAENTAVTKGFNSLLESSAVVTNDIFKQVRDRLDIIGADTAETKATAGAIMTTVTKGG